MDGNNGPRGLRRLMQRTLTLSVYELNSCVPSSSQGSVAALSSAYGDDDTFSDLNTEDDSDNVFPTPWPPIESQEHYAMGADDTESLEMIEELTNNQWVGCQSSETNSFSFMTSLGGATCSWENPTFLYNQMNEEDAVDSLPQPLHRDEKGELKNQTAACQRSEISKSYKETTINNDEAFRSYTSDDPNNISNGTEIDYGEETFQPDELLEIDNHRRKCETPQIIFPFQPKTYIPESDYDATTRNGNIYNFLRERHCEESMTPGSSFFLADASRPSSSAGGQSISPGLQNSDGTKVRFKVKSFTVPEFIVEVPENQNFAFWKKAIAEKVTDMMIGVEEQLDVFLHGEEIRDENRTLLKSGISTDKKLDVIMEPEYLPEFSGSSPHHVCVPLTLQPQTWCNPLSSMVQGTDDTSRDSFMSLLKTPFHNNHERLEYLTDGPIANGTTSMAAIASSAMNGSLDLIPKNQSFFKASKCKRLLLHENALDAGPSQQKSNSSNGSKRRKTEFFSFVEVEALVEKVDELGIGNWQKIKEQAFGKDSRRTYMDVKDKWRSLVKTANRPVHGRRGVPLPPELLDRVKNIEARKSKIVNMRK